MLHETASHNVGRHGFVGADTVRSRSSDKIVGYDSISGKFSPTTSKANIQVAVALKGGIIVGRVKGVFEPGQLVFRGPILKGSGKFLGVDGTMVAKLTNSKKTYLTLTYHY